MSDPLQPHGMYSLSGSSVHGISRQEYWSGLPFPPPGDLPDPGMELESPATLALVGALFTTEPPGKPKLYMRVKVLFSQSCPILCDPMNWFPLPGCSVHGILLVRILEWVAIHFSRGSFHPREQTWVSCTTGRFFTIWATREAQIVYKT